MATRSHLYGIALRQVQAKLQAEYPTRTPEHIAHCAEEKLEQAYRFARMAQFMFKNRTEGSRWMTTGFGVDMINRHLQKIEKYFTDCNVLPGIGHGICTQEIMA